MLGLSHPAARSAGGLVIAFIVLFDAAQLCAVSVTYDTRVLSGDPAPDAGPGEVFLTFTAVDLNAAGQTAFIGYYGELGVSFTQGAFSEGHGSLESVARAGEVAPGMGGLTYRDVIPRINDAGQTAVTGTVNGPGFGMTEAIWSEDGSGAQVLVARQGGAAPGTGAGVTFSDLGLRAYNNLGQTAFGANVSGTGVNSTNSFGVWSQGGGPLSLVAREGNAAPGTGPGVVFGRDVFFNPEPVLNDAGETAFFSYLTGTGVNNSNNQGIWSQGGGPLRLVARTGDLAPGTEPDVRFLNFSNYLFRQFNNSGQAAFKAAVDGSGVGFDNGEGIWFDNLGSLSLVVREGDAAPGTGPDVVFQNNLHVLDIDELGQLAIYSSLAGPGVDSTNDFGIWLETGGSFDLVVREGDAAPGTEPDVVFSGFFEFVAFNNVGQTAFIGNLAGPDVDGTNNRGLWATDQNGALTLVARQGDLFDINDDPSIEELRTTSNIAGVSPGHAGGYRGFNDSGQLALHLYFTDASEGIFVAKIGAPIPEPTALQLAIMAGLSGAARRKRRACS